MQKKYVIILVVVIVIWVAFMGYRYTKKKQTINDHNNETHDRVTEMAKKSPRAGLSQVGIALKRYHKVKGVYPPSLIDLYPEYMSNKALIEEIEWDYKPRGQSFYLAKSVNINGRQVLASIDQSLRPQTDQGIMVAKSKLFPKATASPIELASLPSSPASPKPARVTEDIPPPSSADKLLKALERRRLAVTSVTELQEDESRIVAAVEPEIFQVTEIDDEEGSGAASALSGSYLVWKDKQNGAIAIGNVQYPDQQEMTLYTDGRWFGVNRNDGEDRLTTQSDMPPQIIESVERGGREVRDQQFASNTPFLVWKNQRGVIGFGNVDYPDQEIPSVYQDEDWVHIDRRTNLAQELHVDEKPLMASRSDEAILAQVSNKYLVWKNEMGTIGIGDTDYPKHDLAEVYEANDWAQLTSSTASPAQDHEKAFEQQKSREAIAASCSNNCLVWKDKFGTYGFGDTEYPKVNVTVVSGEDNWNKSGLDQEHYSAASQSTEDNAQQNDIKTIVSALSDRYLIWEDSHGGLGLGNVDYPEQDTTNRINVSGSWIEVSQ